MIGGLGWQEWLLIGVVLAVKLAVLATLTAFVAAAALAALALRRR